MSNETGKLVVVSGPSGVGKSTISKAIVDRLGAYLNVSMTTRPMGKGEVDGKDYWFVSLDEFKGRRKKEDEIEQAEQRFKALDKDGDKKLSLKEFTPQKKEPRKGGKKGAGKRGKKKA